MRGFARGAQKGKDGANENVDYQCVDGGNADGHHHGAGGEFPGALRLPGPDRTRNQGHGGYAGSDRQREIGKIQCARKANGCGDLLVAQQVEEIEISQFHDEQRHQAKRTGKCHHHDMPEDGALQEARRSIGQNSNPCFLASAARASKPVK